MRSDREELPEGFTKEEADQAETREYELQQRQSAVARGPAPGPGCQQYWPSDKWVCGAIRDKYNSLGAQFSFLLWPTSDELTSPDGHGKFTTFMNGPIYWSAAGGAHPVVNSILNRWGVHGYETGWLGYPTTDEIVHTDGAGRRQEFQNGAIYVAFQNAVGSAIKNGPIRDKYNTLGAHSGALGYPSSDEIAVTKNNGRYNNFVNGTITWSTPTGARVLYGAVRDRWFQFGREDGVMGYPTGDEYVLADGIGHAAKFEDGSAIYSYPVIGAWQLSKKFNMAFEYLGAQAGKLGYPTKAAVNLSPGGDFSVRQEFQKGFIGLKIDDGRLVVMSEKTMGN